MSNLQEKLLWLCTIPSFTGDEQRLADELSQRLATLPTPAPLRRHENSLVVPLSSGTHGPKVLLVAQLDVADAGQPSPPKLADGRLTGAGAADAKSGLCMLLELGERAPALRCDVTLLLHARGEAGFDLGTLGPLMKREPQLAESDFALVLKPTDNKLQLGCAGSTQATLALMGRGGHSGLRGAGRNAIHRFADVLTRIARFEPVADVVDGLTWYELMNVTSAHGGRALTIVPNEFEVSLHHTFGPSSDCEASQDKLMAMMDGFGAVRFEELSEAAAPNRVHPLVKRLEQSGVLAVEARQTWTEVGRFAAMGIAAANFGPGAEYTAHSRQEAIDVASLEVGFGILSRWLEGIGG